MAEGEGKVSTANSRIFQEQATAAKAQKKELQTKLVIAEQEVEAEKVTCEAAQAHAEKYREERNCANVTNASFKQEIQDSEHHHQEVKDLMEQLHVEPTYLPGAAV